MRGIVRSWSQVLRFDVCFPGRCKVSVTNYMRAQAAQFNIIGKLFACQGTMLMEHPCEFRICIFAFFDCLLFNVIELSLRYRARTYLA